MDENLSPELAATLTDLFPGSIHVQDSGLGSTSDIQIWEYANNNNFILFTKDKDFANLSLAWGAPQKVVVLELGNCSTSQVEKIVRGNAIRFSELDRYAERSLLTLRWRRIEEPAIR